MKQTMAILERAKSEEVSPATIFRAVCRDVNENTGANRVSIWHFEGDGNSIRCACFYVADKEEFSEGQVLYAEDQPEYFKAILTEKYIVASDARNHTATTNFTDKYFREHNIFSLLDFILYDNFKPVGVICCENAGELRDWSKDDVAYLRAISTIISFYFKAKI